MTKKLCVALALVAIIAVGGFSLVNSPSEADIIKPMAEAVDNMVVVDPKVAMAEKMVAEEQEMPVVPEAKAKIMLEPSSPVAPIQAPEFDLKAALADRVLGNDDAPVTIIEYASLTCDHCATFHGTSLPSIKKQLLETGKAKLILRDFPLDSAALKASMMARCAPADEYYNLMELLFSSQKNWKYKSNPESELKRLASLTGMSSDEFDACMDNKALEKGILRNMKSAQTFFEIRSTPSFVFNNGAKTIVGVHPVEVFAEITKNLTK